MTKGYSINFNPDTSAGPFGDQDGGPETALVMHDMPCAKDGHPWTGDQFFILKGDWRREYAKIEKSWPNGHEFRFELKRLYDRRKGKYGSRWSSDFHEWGADGQMTKGDPKKRVIP